MSVPRPPPEWSQRPNSKNYYPKSACLSTTTIGDFSSATNCLSGWSTYDRGYYFYYYECMHYLAPSHAPLASYSTPSLTPTVVLGWRQCHTLWETKGGVWTPPYLRRSTLQ